MPFMGTVHIPGIFFTSRKFTRYSSSAPTMRTLLTASVYRPLEPPLQSVKMQFTSSEWNMNWWRTGKEHRREQALITVVNCILFCLCDWWWQISSNSYWCWRSTQGGRVEPVIRGHSQASFSSFSIPNALVGSKVPTSLNDSTPVTKIGLSFILQNFYAWII